MWKNGEQWKKEVKFEYTRTGPFFWMFVDKDNCKFVKIQICYGEYLWLLDKKKETEGDSLLEGKCLSLLMVMENKEEKYGHSLQRLLLSGIGKWETAGVLSAGGGSICYCNHCWIIIRLRREPNIDIMHWITHIAEFIYLQKSFCQQKSICLLHPEIQRSLASSTPHWLRLTKPAMAADSSSTA